MMVTHGNFMLLDWMLSGAMSFDDDDFHNVLLILSYRKIPPLHIKKVLVKE